MHWEKIEDLEGEDIDAFVEGLLRQIRSENESVNALITFTPEIAEEGLRRALAARSNGRALALDGMPVVVKDNIDVAGVRGTVGSALFTDRVPTRSAVVVENLRKHGATFLAMANLHELAYGGTSSNPHFGFVRNPWDLSRIPGGSSGGSAVAVALDWAVGALGTDTGGSVRCPAAMTGITGLRPTHGAVSNEGVFPLAESFDTVGFMARRAADVQRLFLAAADSIEADEPKGTGLLRIGIPENPFFGEVSESIRKALDQVASVLRDLGHDTSPVEVVQPEECDHVARSLANYEAFVLHKERLARDRHKIGVDVANRLELGARTDSVSLAELRQSRAVLARQLDRLLAEVDLLLVPTVPVAPARLGSGEMLAITERALRFTYLWGIAGLPALTFPCGFDDEGMPIGAQLVGARGTDVLLCQLADQYQSVSDWHLRRPPRPLRAV